MGTSLSLQAEGSCILEHLYPYQFVQNEVTNPYHIINNVAHYELKCCQLLKNTMAGTVYVDCKPIYTFVERKDGTCSFNAISERSIDYIKELAINHQTGEIKAEWSRTIGNNHYLVVSYEYNIEVQL